MTAADPSNEGRLSTGQRLDRIETKLDHLIEITGALSTQAQINKQRIDVHDSDIHDLMVTLREEVKCRENEDDKLDTKIDDLTAKSNTWDKVNTGLTAVAAVIGSMFGGRQ